MEAQSTKTTEVQNFVFEGFDMGLTRFGDGCGSSRVHTKRHNYRRRSFAKPNCRRTDRPLKALGDLTGLAHQPATSPRGKRLQCAESCPFSSS